MDAFWSRFRKLCFHSKKYLRVFPIFSMSSMKLLQARVFIILAFRSFPVSFSFVLSSQCRRNDEFGRAGNQLLFFCAKKRVRFWTRVWLHLRLRKSSPPPPPHAPCSETPFSFEYVSVRVYMKVRPCTQKYKFAQERLWKHNVSRFLSSSGSALFRQDQPPPPPPPPPPPRLF